MSPRQKPDALPASIKYMPRPPPPEPVDATGMSLDQLVRMIYGQNVYLVATVADVEGKLENGKEVMAAHSQEIAKLNARITILETAQTARDSYDKGLTDASAPARQRREAVLTALLVLAAITIFGLTAKVLVDASRPITANAQTTATTYTAPAVAKQP